MPAVKITNKPIGIPGDDTHFLVTQPELPEGYTRGRACRAESGVRP